MWKQDVNTRWDATNGSYLAGRAALDALDHIAAQMETKWGCGRLRLLVDNKDDVAAFDRQRFKLNEAIREGTLKQLTDEAGRMCNAWVALDEEAEAAGKVRLDQDIWEVTMSDGSVVGIVQSWTPDIEGKVTADGRALVIYSLDDIAMLLEAHREVLTAKRTWPGAKVTRVSKDQPSDPLDAIAQAHKLEDDFILPEDHHDVVDQRPAGG